MADRDTLSKLFQSLDLDSNGSLNASEISKAFGKIGLTPTLAEIGAMIKEHDRDGGGELSFEEFCLVCDRVQSGSLPATTGIAKLIKAVWEEYLATVNKPVLKNEKETQVTVERKVEIGKGFVMVDGRWQHPEKVTEIEHVQKKYKPGTLPAKKSLSDLP